MSSWRHLPDADAVRETAVAEILQSADQAITARGRFRIVLAGGTTPRAIYRELAARASGLSRWALYYGDERCLPTDHPERNSRMVEDSGLAARAGAHHPIPAELGAEPAAASYAGMIAPRLPFDLVLLGIGEDGHTASLFPGLPWPDEDALVVPVHGAPKPPPERVSLAPRALRACARMLVIATGDSKAAALARWRAGETLPIQRVSEGLSHCLVLTDLPPMAFSSTGTNATAPAPKPARPPDSSSG